MACNARRALAALGLLTGLVPALVGVGCTKVNEQPPAPVVAAPSAAAPTAKRTERDRRPARTPWPVNEDDARQAAAARRAAARSNAAAAGENAGDSEEASGPTREKLQKVLDEALPTLTPCWNGETSLSTTIAFEAVPSGKAENVRMPGAPPKTAACVAERLGALALPSYTGAVISITIPVSVSQQVVKNGAPAGTASSQAAAPSAATTAGNTPPKLFVSP